MTYLAASSAYNSVNSFSAVAKTMKTLAEHGADVISGDRDWSGNRAPLRGGI